MLRLLPVLLLAWSSAGLLADELIPFVLPFDDGGPGPTSLAGISPAPAGSFGFVQSKDGHLWAGPERLRLWGVNITGDSCFPDRPIAELVAGRLAKFGVNAVRFHHMDNDWGGRNIFDPAAGGTRRLGADALDRLDYFVAALKARGIYADLNLLVSRHFHAGDGLPADIAQMDWKLQHTAGFFNDRLLELQKEYARQLLTHVNPYTKTRYVDEPAVALVEINNENGLVHSWLGGSLDRLPKVYADELAAKWNAWLKARYSTTEKLRAAWGSREEAAGAEMFQNADWSRGTDSWVCEAHQGAKATLTLDQKARAGATVVHLEVEKPGSENWHVQFHQPGLKVEKGRIYTLRFQARADKKCTVSIALAQAHEPWQQIGFSAPVELDTQWRSFQFTLQPGENDDNARMVWGSLGLRSGSYWLGDLSLQPGGTFGLTAAERVEDGKVPVLEHGTNRLWPPAGRADWVRFLWETEGRYWQAMYQYLKDELKVKSLVMGTSAGCSPATIQADLDVVDGHAYWQHPHFPGKPWDPSNWIVANQSMVAEAGGVLVNLAMQRVAGKPFTVTEYNHAAPNTFAGEAPLLLAALAAFQDWDGLFLFDYSVADAKKISGFFDISQHPTKMVNMVAGGALFRGTLVAPGKELVSVTLTPQQELATLAAPSARSWQLVNAETLGVTPQTALVERVALQMGATTAPGKAPTVKPIAQHPREFVADTGQLAWMPAAKGNVEGRVVVNAPRCKMAVGFIGEQFLQLGEIGIKTGKTRQNWAAISLVLLAGESFQGPAKGLILATGYAENTHMGWKNREKNTVGKDWGEAPSLVEVIPAAIFLPVPAGRVEVWALDEKGQRGQALVVREQAGLAVVDLGPPAKTLWYEVEIR